MADSLTSDKVRLFVALPGLNGDRLISGGCRAVRGRALVRGFVDPEPLTL
jgi:hypothetical protein